MDESLNRIIETYDERGKILDDVNDAAPWLKLYRETTWLQIREAFQIGSVVLDAGGGTGLFARALAAQGRQVVLADITHSMLVRARSNAPSDGQASRFQCVRADIANLGMFRDGVFDGVLCTQTLNFIRDRSLAFNEFYRVLRLGGTLFCDVDGAFRWVVIEMLAGRIDNAISVAKGRDAARSIVNT
jgi:ubiquinone/menaquinone biosynthesis C-methylase UbiE